MRCRRAAGAGMRGGKSGDEVGEKPGVVVVSQRTGEEALALARLGVPHADGGVDGAGEDAAGAEGGDAPDLMARDGGVACTRARVSNGRW